MAVMRVFSWRWLAVPGLLPLAPWHAVLALPGGACPAPQDLTRLSGTWQAEALAHVNAGVAPSLQRLQLQVGQDGRVSGQRDWAARDTSPGAIQGRDRRGNPAFRDVQPMIGWIDPRSCRVLLVETEDNGRVSGWLRQRGGQPVLELEISQSGPGAVAVLADFGRLGSIQAGATPNP